MGILRKLIQWREKSDGTLEGPALSTEEGSVETVDEEKETAIPNVAWVGENVGGADGFSFEEVTTITEDIDDNGVSISVDSPRNVLIHFQSVSHDEGVKLFCRVDGNSDDDYAYLLEDESGTISRTESDDRFFLHEHQESDGSSGIDGWLIFGRGSQNTPYVRSWAANRVRRKFETIHKGSLDSGEDLQEIELFANDGQEISVDGEIEVLQSVEQDEI